MRVQAVDEVRVACMWQLNKRDYQCWLSDDRCLKLRVADMFSVVLTEAAVEVARITFQPLSSLNNMEMPPVYRVAFYQAPQGELSALARTLLESMLSVYAFYTNGTIRPWRA